MKITVLMDNNTLIDRYLIAEPALSIFIEADGKRVLFDTGYTGGYIRNALRLGIDLEELDYVVLSHGHLDHTWGLVPLIQLFTDALFEDRTIKKPSLVAHPDVFASRRHGDKPEIGMLLTQEKLGSFFNLQISQAPIKLTDKLWFLGEIERLNSFEAREPLGKILIDGQVRNDFITDDSALVYESKDGLIIITGCSHSGVCNIIETARKICSDDRIIDIIGGFHLQKPSEHLLDGTISYLEKIKPETLHACHCTDLDSKLKLARSFNIKEVGSGLILEY